VKRALSWLTKPVPVARWAIWILAIAEGLGIFNTICGWLM
jgi:hypothetical protein